MARTPLLAWHPRGASGGVRSNYACNKPKLKPDAMMADMSIAGATLEFVYSYVSNA